MRRLLAVVTAVTSGLVGGSAGLLPSSADEPAAPALVGFEYLNGPYVWVGEVNTPVAEVVLDSPAPFDTTVSVSSDSAGVLVPDSVVVPTGSTSATVPVTAIAAGTATLTAGLGGVSVPATPALEARNRGTPTALSDLVLEPTSVHPGGTATATVVLDFLAPAGGVSVAITSSQPEATVPASITIAQDQYRATFDMTAPHDHSGDIVITATLDGVSREATLAVVEHPDPDISTQVELRYRKAAAQFRGSVVAASGCRSARKVTVYRIRSGADARVGAAITTSRGGFVVKKAAKRGRYYAKAAPKELAAVHCLAGRSPAIRVR